MSLKKVHVSNEYSLDFVSTIIVEYFLIFLDTNEYPFLIKKDLTFLVSYSNLH